MGWVAFDWLKRAPEGRAQSQSRSDENVSDLIARKKFARALTVIRAQFESGNRSPELRLQYSEALVETGRGEEAVPVLLGVADELSVAARTRAIEALRRIERIDPGREDVAMRLASLGG
jgi:thioredoxin-like negative regulator of GroEL